MDMVSEYQWYETDHRCLGLIMNKDNNKSQLQNKSNDAVMFGKITIIVVGLNFLLVFSSLVGFYCHWYSLKIFDVFISIFIRYWLFVSPVFLLIHFTIILDMLLNREPFSSKGFCMLIISFVIWLACILFFIPIASMF